MEKRIKLQEEDLLKLESLHYAVEARGNLFERMMTSDRGTPNAQFKDFLKEYEDLYRDYTDFKLKIEDKYKPEDMRETAKSWSADFEAKEIIFKG